eukprot:gnl/TRDRNA2_/TRDRNA2_51307_c0_seq1.p1 gnl/TRDRNA2_/TRDRNA2_51307_c0~~gnl/TRDRNA2_/TRDRNA2_51307_c0_seq1.p1  ORF type:complete len:115 (+),score=6.85 gnl/TRDRNA2_/TRDRNA2_51307_c0_seq1:106-450(+)
MLARSCSLNSLVQRLAADASSANRAASDRYAFANAQIALASSCGPKPADNHSPTIASVAGSSLTLANAHNILARTYASNAATRGCVAAAKPTLTNNPASATAALANAQAVLARC